MFEQASLFGDIGNTVPIHDSQEKAVALMALASVKGVGFATVKALCDEYRGELREAFATPESTLIDLLYDARTPSPANIASEIRRNGKHVVAEGRRLWAKYREKGVSVVFRGDQDYPSGLLDLPSPPSWLFVEGDLGLLHSKFVVGFVGTRAPTDQGVKTGRRAAAYLAQINSVILSGLAEGIDAVGHQAALLFGAPTIAVLGHGLDVVFPASTAKVRQDIVLFGGAVVSEYLPWDTFSRERFVHRNRIQAALSKSLCFVEARERSGTAHTLRFAQQLDRAVFGVRVGDFRGVPEEELLHAIERGGGRVYDIEREECVEALTRAIHAAFAVEPRPASDDAPRMFRNIAREVRRLAEDYKATKQDIDWLRRELGKIPTCDLTQDRGKREARSRRQQSGSQGGDS